MKRFTLFFACLFLSIGAALAQQKVVSGVVIGGDDNQPLIGASVVVKGLSGVGGQTNIDGKFSFQAPASAKTIVVSSVGYTSQEVAIKPNMRIVLKPEAIALDDVIVVAFGKAKKSAYTGSATQVDAKELSKRQVSNVTQALAGKAPGVTVSSGNNQPGTSASLRIRGIGSFSAKTTPLYVVDGVPFDGDISSINPQDVESTSVLKDAASAALYGARGANGVIMIQTKNGSGNQDKINVTFEARYGINMRGVGDYDVIKDPKVYAAKYFEALYNNQMLGKDATHETAYAAAVATYFSKDPKVANLGYHPFTFPEGQDPFVLQPNGSFIMNPGATVGAMYTGTDGEKYWLTPDDWGKEIFSNNPRQEYNLSISGRSKNANYYMSAGYLNDKGYTVASSFERFTSRLRGDYRPKDWVKFGGNLAFTHYKSNMLSNTDEGGNSGNIFALTNFIAPIYPVYVRDEKKAVIVDKWNNKVYDFGDGTYPGLTRPYLSIANPLAKNTMDVRDNVADIISARGFVDFILAKGLTATANVGYDVDNTYSTDIGNTFYGQFSKSGGFVWKGFTRNTSINLQQLLTYNTNFGKHHFDALLGHEFYKNIYHDLSGEKSNMYDPYNLEISGAILKPSISSSSSRYATEGYLGRVQYDYDNKYFGQFSYRRDASSNFAKNHRWGNFWSVGASWLISNEDFMKGVGFDMLKLKASYGMQGNDAVGSFRYMDLYQLKNANDQLGVSFLSKGNPNLTWETSANLNVGVEFALLKNRISGGVDFYTREVSDMLFWRPAPRSAGYSGYYDNIGAMRNTGIDFELKGVLVKTADFYWDLSVNGGFFKNKLTKLPEEWEALGEVGYRDGSAVYRVGGSFYDRAYPKFLGLDDQGRSRWQTYNAETKEYGETTEATEAQKKENRVIYTDIAPKWNGGINTSIEFHGVDFSMGISYALGGRIYDNTYAQLMHGGAGGSAGTNWHKDILNSWTPKNNTSTIPMVNYGGKYFNSLSDRFLISRNYLALNNVTIGYTLPAAWLSKYGMSAVRLYLVGDNLALFSARKGFDPRFGSGVGYKTIRAISGGIRITL